MNLSKLFKTYLPLVIAALFALIVTAVWLTRPQAKRGLAPPSAQIEVAVLALAPADIPITITSYGLAQPLTQTTLVARVGGVVEHVDENFREGGQFSQGQLLVALDKADYQIELDIARAQVAEAQSRYQSEVALAEEARYDWQRSGRAGEPPALALRKPQLLAAEAALKAARATVKRAQLNLQRTEIVAPYAGRVLRQLVDVGQVVNVNAPLAEIFASAVAEVNLPIKNQDLALLNLPQAEYGAARPRVRFTSQLGSEHHWQGEVVRVAAALDDDSRQLHVVARIEQPFGGDTGALPLKIGEYLTAEIEGVVLQQALVVPDKSIYQGSYVYLYQAGKVYRREVNVAWSDGNRAWIDRGLNAGEQVVLTPLGQVNSGTPVRIAGESGGSDAASASQRAERQP